MTLTTISGLPAHVLLVHAVVVLAPLTALLEMLCAVWPAARRRLVWLVAAFAAVTAVLTPITANAGEWLYGKERHHRDVLNTHADLGSQMVYYAIALVVVAVLLVVLDRRDVTTAVRVVVAVVAIVVGVASIVQVVRTGDTGARSVWGSGP